MSFVLATGLAGAASAHDDDRDRDNKNRWSLFGDAQVINQPVALSSVCTTFPNAFGPGGCLGTDAPPNSFTFSGASYKVPKKLKFSDILELSTMFDRTDDDCGAGSPRFQVRLDLNGNGVDDGSPTDGNIFIYLGPYPNFTGCAPGWQSSGNLIQNTELRFDLTQVGGTFYDTYATALALHANKRVLGISLVVDSGWNGPATGEDGEQTIPVANTSVNGNKLAIKDNNDDD
jgi:hypothetical protein